jgi:simple sugar transport system ATP-binding protein
VRARRRAGVAFISEDRDQEGVVMDAPIRDSAISLRYHREPLARGGFLQLRRVREFVSALIERFGIRAGRQDAPVRSLSGGNVQRLVVARELSERPKLIVASHPTRGVDIRGVAFVHDRLRELRAAGAAVLLVSGDLDELLALSDRLVVLYEGRVAGRLDGGDVADRARVGRMMAGAEGTT